ncbi:MAG: aldehyde dehydrogenase family protein [Segniliparus sp.]|uniref:aldehyde dehydrogenase family protein n=1 Tax=Segniliparus sp. TaxID=2804064 RepID=UPI003F35DEA1
MALLRAETWAKNIFLGEWARGSGGEHPVVEPATGQQLGVVGLAGEDDLARAVSVARQAQPAWAAASAAERSAVLRRAGEALVEATAEVSGWLIREGGGTSEKAAFETELATGECFAAAALALHPVGEVVEAARGLLSYATRVPAGIVAVIAPFNAPLQLAVRSVAPALALGNAVILKPDPRTAVSGGAAVAAAFEAAGLPAGLLSVLPAGAEVGAALVARPEVDVVSFTGSTAAGRAVGQAAASHFAKAHLELGGNSALVVLPGVDLDWAARLGARGSFFHQGQICMATGRHLVHEDIADEYVARLAAIAHGLRVGDPTRPETDLGPIIDERQRDRIHALVAGSVEQGAELVEGGRYDGLFYRPTVLAGARADTPAYANEVFGPVAAVRAFADVDEAVAIANDSEYGLTLGVLAPDVALGLEIADRIPTGIAHINDQTIADTPLAPMGGVRASGAGSHFGGLGNLAAFTETRWTTVAAARV